MKKKKGIFQARYIVLLGMIAISVVCIMAIYGEIDTTFELKQQIKEAEKVRASLNEEKSNLKKMETNLNDKDYIVRYARGRYMVTKEDGEQVFKLPVDKEK